MRGLGLLFLISSSGSAAGHAAECDEFVSLVAPAKTSYQNDLRNTDWRAIVQVMRGRLADAILNHPVRHSQGALGPEMLPLN
jgi:hypothetical protein